MSPLMGSRFQVEILHSSPSWSFSAKSCVMKSKFVLKISLNKISLRLAVLPFILNSSGAGTEIVIGEGGGGGAGVEVEVNVAKFKKYLKEN